MFENTSLLPICWSRCADPGFEALLQLLGYQQIQCVVPEGPGNILYYLPLKPSLCSFHWKRLFGMANCRHKK